MGLDSVELLMEFENFFEIEVPDDEATKMRTIADAVTYISNHIEFTDHAINIKEEIFKDLANAFSKFNISISQTDLVFETLSIIEEQTWIEISKITDFEIPLSFSVSKIDKLFNKIFPNNISYDGLDFKRYTNLIGAINYQRLISKGNVKNEYEVMIAVMGITIEKIGVSPFEVFWNSSFTNDLGVN